MKTRIKRVLVFVCAFVVLSFSMFSAASLCASAAYLPPSSSEWSSVQFLHIKRFDWGSESTVTYRLAFVPSGYVIKCLDNIDPTITYDDDDIGNFVTDVACWIDLSILSTNGALSSDLVYLYVLELDGETIDFSLGDDEFYLFICPNVEYDPDALLGTLDFDISVLSDPQIPSGEFPMISIIGTPVPFVPDNSSIFRSIRSYISHYLFNDDFADVPFGTSWVDMIAVLLTILLFAMPICIIAFAVILPFRAWR